MPIKIPKGFQRRKSSSNVLDEVQSTEPSFKVFSRPQTGNKSLDNNLGYQKSIPQGKGSFDQEDEDLFTVMRPDAANRYVPRYHETGNRPDPNSGSGGTTTSLSTAPYNSSASSTRLSSSSTIPSSVDTRSDKNVHAVGSNAFAESHPPPPPTHVQKSGIFSRNAGRTFSFGVKSKPLETSEPPAPAPSGKSRFSVSTNRERAETFSSVATATPPRLLESDLTLDNPGLDTFGNMFDKIGAKPREPSPIRATPHDMSIGLAGNQLRQSAPQGNRSALPQPISADRNTYLESSPYSWTSETSRDGLMQTPSSAHTVVHNTSQLASERISGTSAHPPDMSIDDNMFSDTPSRPRALSRPNRQNGPPPSSFSVSIHSHLNAPAGGSSIKTSPILETDDTEFDPSLLASAELATKYQEIKPSKSTIPTTAGKRIMTPAQFEKYRQQQDERHRLNKVFLNKHADSDESDDNYDDAEEEDEAERDRQAAKQRRKQEAHLAVYRQTMMKVTGEGPTSSGNSSHGANTQPIGSQSATDLVNHFPAITFDKSPARSSDGDEDEDVPLGILAAHGFPNKNKPPSRLANSSSNPNLRGVIPPQPGPSSVVGDSMKRVSALPVFARHLPEDPYYGAGLVNQSNRESINMSNGYVPSGASTAHPHHPAGLVGVIAGEERARAFRRGSPSGGFDMPPNMPMHPGMGRSQTTGSMPNLLVPGMGGMPGMPPMMPGMMSPGDQAQIQMSQQMTQMMQMQMQWMQQMQQFMSAQGSPQGMPQMPPNLQAGTAMSRPSSVPLQTPLGQEPRTMSMLNPPSLGGWNNNRPSSFHPGAQSNYAPSLAPSERSNVGLASRYRPVSTVQEPEQTWNKRASTMTSTTFRPLSQFLGGSKQQASSTVRKVPATVDDEDDEQGWAEMKAKKDQKKKTWKLRKGQNVLQELYNGTS